MGVARLTVSGMGEPPQPSSVPDAVTSAGVLRHLQLATSHPLGEGQAMSDYYDLGTYSRPVTTNSPAAQVWFDRGLLWCYGYNHEEAVRCFRTAAEHDDGCAMAYWGIAHASGSNYNKRWEAFAEEEWQEALAVARRATEDARARLGRATLLEQALIRALEQRYQSAQAQST